MWNKVHIVLFKHRLEFLSEQCQRKVDILINIIYIIKHWISLSCDYEMPSKRWELNSTGNWMLRAAFKNPGQESHVGPLEFLHTTRPSAITHKPVCKQQLDPAAAFLAVTSSMLPNTTLRELKFFLSCPLLSFSSLSYEPPSMGHYTMLT